MICPKCGADVPASATVCPKCGHTLGPVIDAKGYNGSDGFSDTSLKGLFFDYNGRLNRKRYFFRGAVLGCLQTTLTWILDAIGLSTMEIFSISAATLIATVVTYIGSFSLVARRAHDVGRDSIFFIILMFIPIVNVISGLYLLFKKGDTGPNRFGPDPLEHPNWL